MTMECPVCAETELGVFLDLERVPVLCNQLLPTREKALAAPSGRISLGFCQVCETICNVAFDDEKIDYSQAYENSLHFSPRFQQYATRLVEQLVKKFDLRSKRIVEIGCGKGDFLRMICAAGSNEGIGFDRSYEGAENDALDYRVIRDDYSEKYAHVEADLVCCRHVLEHISKPVEFLRTVHRSMARRPEAIVFFEVPNVSYTLRDLGIWDIIYEHCFYYGERAIVELFERTGFRVRDAYPEFGGQYLCLEADRKDDALKTGSRGREGDSFRQDVRTFTRHFEEKLATWDDRLGALLDGGERIAIWGAGSKGVTFLNLLRHGERVSVAVDINPRKHGKYVPGTGQPVVPPEEMSRIGIDRVLVMNPLYETEIRERLAKIDSPAQVELV